MLSFALFDEAVCGIDANDSPVQLRGRMAEARFKLLGIHSGEHLPRINEIALVDENVLNAAGSLCRDIDLVASMRPLPPAMPSGRRLSENFSQA
ncbi:hypothetical protein LPU83_pLPU83d_1483 (plasmid) [Rhizobium favelukesii]|uniref:Uncharacterized protein n=1 Tax=Rhizobium favelukesii TaxID=348824 RepID=W6RW46_9HYPH|nr:hypothetical protein LPU83_pLPU83d_1483 [Rhizobium favelukesii]